MDCNPKQSPLLSRSYESFLLCSTLVVLNFDMLDSLYILVRLILLNCYTYIYTHTLTHTYIHSYIRTYIHTYIYIYIYICIYIHTYIRVYTLYDLYAFNKFSFLFNDNQIIKNFSLLIFYKIFSP